ncbi:MAG: DUF2726 domain-containing protein [Nitrospira sp.]
MELLFIGVGISAAFLFLLWKWPSSHGAAHSTEPVLVPGTTVVPVPLLSEQDVFLYNLIRLAVQDRLLVFSQVPLWALVRIDAAGEARTKLFRQLAFKRVDFVLMHPGTRQVEQVVLVDDGALRGAQGDRRRVVESVLDAAGIKLLLLKPQKAYTVPALAALLGCSEDEN